jgi:putative nucleotidyltransferase with HDIG domain
MRKEFSKAVWEAKQIISRMKNPDFEFAHAESVARFASQIAREYPEVDPDLIEVAAWWHDVGRIQDKVHEKISAEMASAYLGSLEAEENTCKKVYDAIVFHKWSMQPETIEGEIIRDADKLDFFSVSRWKSCLKENNLQFMRNVAEELPVFKDDYLHLEISKKIFDQVIIDLKTFVASLKHPSDFLEIRKEILSGGP